MQSGRACAKIAMAKAFAFMENSGTGAQTVAVQHDVRTGNRRANAGTAEGRHFVLTANINIGAPAAQKKRGGKKMMMLYYLRATSKSSRVWFWFRV